MSGIAVCDYLNSKDIRTRKGAEWLQTTLARILGNPALYAHKRAEALSCARAWSIESMADRMIGFYSDLIERKRRHV